MARVDDQYFASYNEWVTYAPRVLTDHELYNEKNFRALCYDTKGRLCLCGADFMRARDEKTFPVSWLWPDQVASLAAVLPSPTPTYLARLLQHRQELLEHSNKMLEELRLLRKELTCRPSGKLL